jgi:hypothetical protein
MCGCAEKLIGRCSDDQRLTLLKKLAPHIAAVSCQKHGSFSVQALMDTLHTGSQIHVLCEALRRDIVKIMTHSSGHFVILRFLQRFPYAATRFVDDAIVVPPPCHAPARPVTPRHAPSFPPIVLARCASCRSFLRQSYHLLVHLNLSTHRPTACRSARTITACAW